MPKMTHFRKLEESKFENACNTVELCWRCSENVNTRDVLKQSSL